MTIDTMKNIGGEQEIRPNQQEKLGGFKEFTERSRKKLTGVIEGIKSRARGARERYGDKMETGKKFLMEKTRALTAAALIMTAGGVMDDVYDAAKTIDFSAKNKNLIELAEKQESLEIMKSAEEKAVNEYFNFIDEAERKEAGEKMRLEAEYEEKNRKIEQESYEE